MAWRQHTSRQQPDPWGQVQLGFQSLVRSAVAVNVCMLLISLGLAYLLVSIVVEGPLTTMVKEHTRQRAEVMVTAIEALAPPGTVFGPQMDQKIQEPIKSLIRQGKQHGDSPYFILFRSDGTVEAQGIEPENPGMNRLHQRDADGILYIQLLIEAAKQGGGFVQYKWKKPRGSEPVQKIAYAKMLTGQQWWIASGVYLDDVAKVRDEILYEQGVYLSILAAVLFVLLSVGYRVGNNMGHEIAQPVVEQMKKFSRMADEERGFLAMELHNLVGRVSVLLTTKFSDMPPTGDATTHQVLEQGVLEVVEHFDEGSRDLRRKLFPLEVERDGIGALRQLVKKETKGGGTPHVDLSIDASVPRSGNGRERALYLIAQGLLQNVLLHAKASQVGITLMFLEKKVTLIVADNGIGFDREAARQRVSSKNLRYGLQWMETQVEVYGGRITFDSHLGQGTTVRVIMPWPPESETEYSL